MRSNYCWITLLHHQTQTVAVLGRSQCDTVDPCECEAGVIVIGDNNVLLFIFSTVLQDGHTGLSDEEIPVYTATEGGNITVKCVFDSSETRKYFCKDTWRSCDILIETHGNRAQKGRYSIEYKTTPSAGGVMYVSITQLTKSDSGQYGCGLDKSLAPDPYVEFKISVGDGEFLLDVMNMFVIISGSQ